MSQSIASFVKVYGVVDQVVKSRFPRNKNTASLMILNFIEFLDQETKRIHTNPPVDSTVKLVLFLIAGTYCFRRSIKAEYVDQWFTQEQYIVITDEEVRSVAEKLRGKVYQAETTKLSGDDCLKAALTLLTWWCNKYNMDMKDILPHITLDKAKRILKA